MEDEEFACPDSYSISIRQIMPYLLDMTFKEIKEGVKPSVVLAAIKLTTEERLEKLRSPLRKYKVCSKRDAFSRCPEAIIFQNFKKGVLYTTPLTITNQHTVPHNIKIYAETARHFDISMGKGVHQTKIAPGMSFTLQVDFLPTEEFRDYVHRIKFVSDEECFVVPVLGFGPRALVNNMPDKIVFPSTLVKVRSSTTVMVKNSGIVPLECVHIINKPFFCSITKAILAPDDILESTYSCYPFKIGLATGVLKSVFRNDLCIATELECKVHGARVQLESQLVTFEDVFMGLSSQKTLLLHNTSEFSLHFSWKKYNEEDEEKELNKLRDLMINVKEQEENKYAKLKYMDILSGENHADIYKRILEDEQAELTVQDDMFLFGSQFFDIIPRVGKVLPRSDFDFSIIFHPLQNILYNSSAYLDIEGVEKRVCVTLQGYGIGPPVKLCVKKINASYIYLTDKHQFELAVSNKGVIHATVTYQPKPTDWGGVINIVPSSLVIGPDITKAFLVVFHSDVQGDFLETLDFIVEESKDKLQCIFTGSVVCPLLKYVPEVLDFGTVSVGLSYTKEMLLINDSKVEIGYEIEVEPSLRDVVQISCMDGSVHPRSQDKLMVTFCCSTVFTYQKYISIMMWKSKQYTKNIPLKCICTCARIVCNPDKITIKFCFVNCPYQRTIQIKNLTDLPGYVEYKTKEKPENQSIKCIPNITKFNVQAREVVEIELTIIVTALGLHELPLYFAVTGGTPQKICTIYCNGQGPVISYHPDEINFGKIEVLTKYTQTLTLTNDSPIPAKVRVYCKSKNLFEIEDSVVELAPEENSEVKILALFNDAKKIKDQIYLDIAQSDTFTIKVIGEGVGPSIVFIPSLSPKLDLGAILTYKHCVQEVAVINKSSSYHRILFSQRSTIRNMKEEDFDQYPSTFLIDPRYLELEPEQESKLTIKCSSKKVKSCNERYYCHALIGKSTHPQTLYSILISAQFVDPTLKFSRTDFYFNINGNGDVGENITKDVLHFQNETSVPFRVAMTIDENFALLEDGERQHQWCQELSDDVVATEIEYCPSIKEKRKYEQRGRIIFEYDNHPKTDVVNLYGKIMFPTVKLHPNIVDFQCIPLGSTTYKTIIIHNISAMEVKFKWFWLEETIKVTDLKPVTPRRKVRITEHESSSKFMDYIDNKILNKENDSVNTEVNAEDQASETLEDAESETYLTYDSNKYMEEMRKVLYPILNRFMDEPADDFFFGQPPLPSIGYDVTDLFPLEPSEGVLKPNEYTLITVGFYPPLNTEVRATAVCDISGGEEEELIVMGKSSELSYELDKNIINFGNKVFCEMCTDELLLTNNGYCCIEYKVILEETEEMQPQMLDITPKIGNVAPEKTITFEIKYYPGFPGEFKKSFVLELGYLEPVTVNVHGYAVFSQIFLHLPRTDLQLNVLDAYKSISWITSDYLESVQNIQHTAPVDDQPNDPANFLDSNDWCYVSYNDQYPSLMDINMAMERVIAFNLTSQNKQLLQEHTLGKKIPNIPHLSPAPYCVDFGYVVRDIPVCYTVLLYNYGPINASVKLLEDNKMALCEKEFKIEFKNKTMLPGETHELYVLFSPTKHRCPVLDAKLEDAISLCVSHGPILKVQLKAIVILPSVCLEHDTLCFEKVYCGDAVRKSIILTNNGKVPCKWFVSISKPTRKEEGVGFFVIPKEGTLEQEEKTYLQIYFVPTRSIRYKRKLQIEIEGNSDRVYMELDGEALETSLLVAPAEIRFSPTLNFFEAANYFAVKNLSGIPVEIYFPTLDKTAEDEKLAIQTYLKYKNLKYVYVPFRSAGDRLTDIFQKTYYELVEKLRAKMIPPSKVNTERSSLDYRKHDSSILKSVQLEDPLAKYSPKEINAFLSEYISAEGFEHDFPSKITNYQSEDAVDGIEIIEPELNAVSEPTERNGILLIFHGAPTTEYYKAANEVGKSLSSPVYSVDRLIIESLVKCDSPNFILEKINEKFKELTDSKSYIDLVEQLEKEDSDYDVILDKIQVILTTKPKKGKKSPTKEKGSKASSEKSQGKGKGANTESFLDIAPDAIVELLRPIIKQNTCLIIESLKSIFLHKENLCLYTILRAAGPIQHIHLIILSFTIHDYIKNEEDKLKKEPEPTVTANTLPQKTKSGTQSVSREKLKSGKESVKDVVSDKKSKGSQQTKKGGADSTKKILQGLPKVLKLELEAFEELQREIQHVSEFWDRKSLTLKKPYNEKAGTGKKDTVHREPSRTPKGSTAKKHGSTFYDESSLNLDDAGIYLWLLLNCPEVRDIDFSQMLRNCVGADNEIQSELQNIEDSKKQSFEESETIFSVISKPKNRQNILTPAFSIKNYLGKASIDVIKPRSKSGSSDSKQKRRRSSKGSRKSLDSKLSTDVTESTIIKTENPDVGFLPRSVINPDEVINYQVSFSPVKCGKFSQSYVVDTTRNGRAYTVTCNAICEYPRIDFRPEVMFLKTLDNYREKASYNHFVYIKDQKIFDFGSVIVGTNLEKSQLYSSDIILRNSSFSVCYVTIKLTNDSFYAEPDNLVIAPKCEERVKLCIRPLRIGTLTAQAFISVKNNPKVEEFTLACTPCKLEFSIFPKIVGFEKVPISYRAKKIVRLTNSSPINLRWEIVDSELLNELFTLSVVKGHVGLYSVSDIVIYFKPTEELVFPRKQFQIKVYDVYSTDDEPCYTELISIHAESVEYNLEVENLINFGEIKGGIDHKFSYTINNKGKSEVAIMIQVINNPLEQTDYVREFFKISPHELILGPQKTENILVNFHPTCNFSVQNMLLFVINMLESIQSGFIVKSYKVKVSATAFMPSFKLCPHSHIDFGHAQLLTSKQIHLQITNTGKFSFSFVLLNYAKFLEAQQKGIGKKGKKDNTNKGTKHVDVKDESKNKDKASKSEDKASKSKDKKTKNEKGSSKHDIKSKSKSETSKGTKSTKTDKQKMKVTRLDIDGFSLVSSSGIVNPNETFNICIEFTPKDVKEHKEEVLLNIMEIEDLQKKKIITLKGFGCEPKVNFNDYEHIFMEQYIVTNLDEFDPPKNVDNVCIFVPSEVALYFKLVSINTSKTIQLYFKNIGYVTANMTVKLDDFGKNVFSVLPVSQKLDPYSTCSFEVTFRPVSLEVVRGMLEISYNASTDNKLTVQIFGQACLPEISLLKPIPKNNETTINFDPICIDYVKRETILFKNVGVIKCKVIVEISNSHGVFEIIATDNTVDKLNIQNQECVSTMKQHLLVNLLPDEVAEFEIVYKPTTKQDIQTMLNLHTINNPFEMYKIHVNASSYDNDVIIEKLQAFKLEKTKSNESISTIKTTVGYLLDLGFKELNKLSKTSFLLRNRSETNTFRFKFTNPLIVFIPGVGHLKPRACKEILVVFKSSEPVVKDREEVDCTLEKIQYVSPNDDPLSWDDRQKFVYWISESRFQSFFTVDSETLDIAIESGSNVQSRKDSHLTHEESDVDIEDKSDVSETIGRPSNASFYSDKQKAITEGMEPEFVAISLCSELIPVYLSVASDYSRYSCDINVINFLDTYIKEKTIQKLEVTNTSVVPLNIKWKIQENVKESITKRSNSSSNITSTNSSKATLQSTSTSSLFSKVESHDDSLQQLPINISPVRSAILPGQVGSFEVTFLPNKVDTYKTILKSDIEALDPSYQNISILLNGNALSIPFCFEYEDGRTAFKDLVLKFESVGCGTECTRKSFLINPNEEVLSFEIVQHDEKDFSYFICETQKGEIKGRKKMAVVFTFVPQLFGTFRQCFLLKLREQNVKTNILLEGLCREPKVYFTESNITLKPTVPKLKTVKVVDLVNDEQFSVSFKFIKKSLFEENQVEKIEIYPAVGKLRPKSKTDVRVTFITPNIVTAKFHAKCMVEKIKAPLFLHVLANCIKVNLNAFFIDRNGRKTQLHLESPNVIDWGYIHKGIKESITFILINDGQTGVFYDWKFDTKPMAHLFKILVEPEKGFLKTSDIETNYLHLEALRYGSLKQFKLKINIMYGPTYTVLLSLTSNKPSYQFSFNEHNFGYCLIQEGETKHYNTVLTFKNLDIQPVSMECLFKKTEHLKVDYSLSTVPPGATKSFPIYFYPQTAGVHKAELKFLIGATHHSVFVTGEGVQVKLELVNPKDKIINFGEVLAGTIKKYRVGVINSTPARMEVHFNLYENLSLHQKKIETLEKIEMKMPVIVPTLKEHKGEGNKKGDKKTDKPEKPKPEKKGEKANLKKQKDQEKEIESQRATELLAKQQKEERNYYLSSMMVVPNMFIDISPHGKTFFEIVFQPGKRVDFEEKIYFETQDYCEPLCIVKGIGVCSEFTLDRRELIFPEVIINCSSTKFVTLKNPGDIIGSFTWAMEEKRNVFDIEPKQGFVLPKSDIKIKVVFAPKHESCDYKTKAKCTIKELKEPLHLLLKGNAIKMPEPKETIVFNCNVREQMEKSIVLTNTTSETWHINPEISDKNFSAPDDVIVPAFADTQINIIYGPKTMTKSEPHKGTMFIKLLNGGGILYELIGHAGPPAISKRIERDIKCKTNFFETLPIQNWLDEMQCFHVSTEIISAITPKTIYKILGVKNIQIDGLQTKEYQWGVYLVNEIPVDFRVTFRNSKTGEYVFYEISLKGHAASSKDNEITFVTRVREPLTKYITLENAIDVPVVYTLDCTERSLVFDKSITLKPYTTTKMKVTYAPIQSEDISTVLIARCEETGDYSYQLQIHAEPPKPEPCLLFKAEMGETVTKKISFKNTFDRVVEFTYEFDNAEFFMERCNPIAVGETSKISVAFDPSLLGLLKSKLFLSSTVAGEYIYPLEGEGMTPTPKGPFTVRAYYPLSIEFKNPFNEETLFVYQIQPDIFTTEIGEEIIRAKKTTKILVNAHFSKETVFNYPITGKLTVLSASEPQLQWTYYLQIIQQ